MRTLTFIIMTMITLNSQSQAPAYHETDHEHHAGGAFRSFIFKTAAYRPDIAEIIYETIDKYGEEEWRAVTLTTEIHGHLGVYSIIGAKMGILAREIFGNDTNDLVVNSFAGQKPPLSCLNDGIQVSTGATVGHGLILISDDPTKYPAADFTLGDKTIRLTLKKEFQEDIDLELNNLFKKCGGLTEEYWTEVRKLGIACWKEMDRKEVFEF